MTAAVISVVLRRQVPLALDGSAYDGLLFARLAHFVRVDQWLGSYTRLTLAKVPGYPVFIAVTDRLGIELKVAEQLVYLAAAATVALAVLVTTRRPWLATCGFVVLALDPVNFGALSSDVLRDSLFSSVGVLALALGFLTCLGVSRRARWVWIVPGALGAGLAAAAYWLTREEGPTLLPPLGVVVLGVVLAAWRFSRRTRAERRQPRWPLLARALLAIVLAGVAVIAPLQFVRAENDAHYGVALLSDMADGTFLRAYADWSRVEAGPRRYHIPVSAEQRAAVYRVSPAARELRRYLEDPHSQWRAYECPDSAHLCDYRGGWMVWELRDAAWEAGYFRSAMRTQDFFARLSRQIDTACAEGRLTCAPQLPASLQPLQRARPGLVAQDFLSLSKALLAAQSLYETPDGVADIPDGFRAEYASVVQGLPADHGAARQQAARFAGIRWIYDGLDSAYRVLVPLLVVAALLGLGLSAYRTVRGRPRVPYLPALTVGLAAGVVLRLCLLAVIQATDYNVEGRYLLPAYMMLTTFAITGIAAGWPMPAVVPEPAGPDGGVSGRAVGTPRDGTPVLPGEDRSAAPATAEENTWAATSAPNGD